jgi:protein-L-isoaspartate(D-aspartate) O-methyltransferase
MSNSAWDHARRRREMVDAQIAARGVRSPRLLDALLCVRREAFVPAHLAPYAHEDMPLAIELEQTISQPYIVAFMLEALDLRPGARVLEVGTGSGYAAAVMAEMGASVFTIERLALLADLAGLRLAREGYAGVRVRRGDGTLGWPEEAPFDAIVVSAGGPRVPAALRAQLAAGGRLVVPVGERQGEQILKRITRGADGVEREEDLAGVRFVPLFGTDGWPEPRASTASGPPSADSGHPADDC